MRDRVRPAEPERVLGAVAVRARTRGRRAAARRRAELSRPRSPEVEPDEPGVDARAVGRPDGATMWVTVDERAAIQTPRSTNATGLHSRIGWVTSYQVKPSARTGPLRDRDDRALGDRAEPGRRRARAGPVGEAVGDHAAEPARPERRRWRRPGRRHVPRPGVALGCRGRGPGTRSPAPVAAEPHVGRRLRPEQPRRPRRRRPSRPGRRTRRSGCVPGRPVDDEPLVALVGAGSVGCRPAGPTCRRGTTRRRRGRARPGRRRSPAPTSRRRAGRSR